MRIECPECGFVREVPADKIPPKAKMATCPKCGQKFPFRREAEGFTFEQEAENREDQDHLVQAESQAEPEADIWSQLESLTGEEQTQDRSQSSRDRFQKREGTKRGIPWENLKAYGFFPGLVETIKLVMFQPQAFFHKLPLGQGYNKPLIFYLLVAEIQALAQFMWRMAGLVPQVGQGGSDFLGLGLTGLSSVLVLVLYPVFLAGMLFVISGLNHLCLVAVKAGARGYEATFKVISYANAPMVLAVVPMLGPLVGMVWTMVCTFLGFKYVHRTTTFRVLMAMLLPIVLIIALSSLIVSATGVR